MTPNVAFHGVDYRKEFMSSSWYILWQSSHLMLRSIGIPLFPLPLIITSSSLRSCVIIAMLGDIVHSAKELLSRN